MVLSRIITTQGRQLYLHPLIKVTKGPNTMFWVNTNFTFYNVLYYFEEEKVCLLLSQGIATKAIFGF